MAATSLKCPRALALALFSSPYKPPQFTASPIIAILMTPNSSCPFHWMTPLFVSTFLHPADKDLKLSCSKTDCLHHTQTYHTTKYQSTRNLEVITDNQLSFTDYISISWAYRFGIYNIRKIQPYQCELFMRALVISCLDYCSVLLTECKISPVHPKSRSPSHITPLFISLHWLPTSDLKH